MSGNFRLRKVPANLPANLYNFSEMGIIRGHRSWIFGISFLILGNSMTPPISLIGLPSPLLTVWNILILVRICEQREKKIRNSFTRHICRIQTNPSCEIEVESQVQIFKIKVIRILKEPSPFPSRLIIFLSNLYFLCKKLE